MNKRERQNKLVQAIQENRQVTASELASYVSIVYSNKGVTNSWQRGRLLHNSFVNNYSYELLNKHLQYLLLTFLSIYL